MEDKGHPRSPPNPTSPGWWLLSEVKPAGAPPSSTKKSGGVLPLKRGPRSVAARTVRENNGTPPALGTLVLTLVSPPLPVLPNPPSRAGLRSERKGTCGGEKGHLTGSPQLPGDPWQLWLSGGKRRVACCQRAARSPCKLSPKPGARIRRAGDAGLEAESLRDAEKRRRSRLFLSGGRRLLPSRSVGA